ncbi:tmcA [Nucleospora cyclopteri]
MHVKEDFWNVHSNFVKLNVRCVIFTSDLNQITGFSDYFKRKSILYFGDANPKCLKYSDQIKIISEKNAVEILGNSVDVAIFENFDKVDPNSFLIVSGAVKGGGIIVIQSKQSLNSLYNTRILKLLNRMPFIIKFDDSGNMIKFPKSDYFEITSLISKKEDVSIGDLEIKDWILKEKENLNNFFNLPSLKKRLGYIIANRGRGKTTLLAIFIADCILKNISKVSILCKSYKMGQNLINLVLKVLKNNDQVQIKLIYNHKSKEITELIINNTKSIFLNIFSNKTTHCDLLIIDEIASLDPFKLNNINFPDKTILSGTVDGYEGTGRNFYINILSSILKDTNFIKKEFELFKPVRYSETDYLESFIEKVFFLRTQEIDESNFDFKINEFEIILLNKEEIFNGEKKSEDLLRTVNELFYESHYRNSPNDLKILADIKDHSLLILTNKYGKIVAAAQCAFENAIKHEKSQNKEGNLISWMMYRKFINKTLLESVGIRIVRIAVSKNLQSKGIGSYFVNQIEKKFIESNGSFNDSSKPVSWIGVSFGIKYDLIRFWLKNDFVPIMINQTPSKSTGEFNTVFIRSKSLNLTTSQKITTKSILNLCDSTFSDLDPFIIAYLLKYNIVFKYKTLFCSEEKKLLKLYIDKKINFEEIKYLFKDVALEILTDSTTELTVIEKIVLIRCGLQRKSISEFSDFADLSYLNIYNIISEIFSKGHFLN